MEIAAKVQEEIKTEVQYSISQQIEEAYLDCLLESDTKDLSEVADGYTAKKNETERTYDYRQVCVAGLKLALPLSESIQIISMPTSLVINNQPENICMAKFEWKKQKYFVINIEKILFSFNTEYSASPGIDKKNIQHKKMVLLENKNMAFLCDQQLQQVSIDKQAITWRGQEGKYQWLAGTAKKQGISILDIQGLIKGVMKLFEGVKND